MDFEHCPSLRFVLYVYTLLLHNELYKLSAVRDVHLILCAVMNLPPDLDCLA